ncbi:hypothetical protein TTRE_0000974401, partial [Trichuris trichiura]
MLQKCYDAFSIKYGACLPSTCSSHDARMLAQLLNTTLGGVGCELAVDCHRRQENADANFGLIITIAFLVVVAFLILFATLYDYFVVQAESKNPPKATDVDSDVTSLVGNSSTCGRTNFPKNPRRNELNSCTFLKVLVAFSLYTNTRKVMSTTLPKGQITCFNGIRVLSMWWIIFGHTYYWTI